MKSHLIIEVPPNKPINFAPSAPGARTSRRLLGR